MMKSIRSQFFALSFATISIGLSGSIIPALAAPAPLFQTVIEDIKDQLPTGSTLRLPAYLPDSPIQLFPYVKKDPMGFGVYLSTQSGCQLSSCTVGAAGVITGELAWPPKGDDRSPVSLMQNVEGYYLKTGNKASNKAHYVYWQQDAQIYVVGALDIAASSEDVIAIAKSMVLEQPL